MNEKKRCAPEYPAIANKLKQEILNGTFNNKDKLFPSENSLAQKYNVSRATLRKALEILKNEGLIEKSQGKRVQITLSKLKRTCWNFSSFSEGLRAMHDEPYSRVDINEIVQDKNNGEEFFHLKRTRGIKRGENIQYLTQEDSYVPLSLFPNINQHDFAKESLYEVMRKDYNIYPYKGVSRISAINANEKLASDFEVNLGQALVIAHQEITDLNDRLIEKVTITYAPELEIKLARDAGH